MAKNDPPGIVKVNESEARNCLDEQVKRAVEEVLEEIMNSEREGLLRAKPCERSPERRD